MSNGDAIRQVVPNAKLPGQVDQPLHERPARRHIARQFFCLKNGCVDVRFYDRRQQIVACGEVSIQRGISHARENGNAIERSEYPFVVEGLARSAQDGIAVPLGVGA